MSVEVTEQYLRLMDSADAGTDDVLELYGDDPVVHSPRAGVVTGRADIRRFYRRGIASASGSFGRRGLP